MEKVQNSSRYENKYVVPITGLYEIKRKLILNGYIIKHKPNIINNLYFDVDDRSFVENIEGKE